jgi:hypothetical protein
MKGRGEMRTLKKALLPAAAIGIAVSVSSCGAGVSTGVYVGVAVPGPYVGYPGVGYPGYIGRPPYVYEEDALNLSAEPRERFAVSDSGGEPHPRCEMDSGTGAPCAADEPEQVTAESNGGSPYRSDPIESPRR